MNFDDIQVGDVFRVKTIGELKDFYKDKKKDFNEDNGTDDFPGFTTAMIKLCGREVITTGKFLTTGFPGNKHIIQAKGWAWRLEWLVPVKTIANNIDIEKVNDLI